MDTDRFSALWAVLGGLFLAGLTSCSTTQWAWATRSQPLRPGVRYEVRPAIVAPGVAFHPQVMANSFFVIAPPAPRIEARPPLVAATDHRVCVRTTAYTHTESDHRQYGSLSALGTPLKYGLVRSAAADWSRYPVGTRFRIPGEPGVVYEVDDYGSALVGSDTIDLYKPTRGMMSQWGVRNVDIEVIQWGSFQRSLELMHERAQYPHVRRMMDAIERSQQSQAAVPRALLPVTAQSPLQSGQPAA